MTTSDPLAEALATLESKVRAELLDSPQQGRLPELELRHRIDDYSSWRQFALAPMHVEDLLNQTSQVVAPTPSKSELRDAILGMLVRLYEDLLAARPVKPTNSDHDQPHPELT